jgi:5-(carboxyamino)imidazole ribonucleotide synthase
VSAVLAVLGGGQLGRMFVHAAQTLGYRTLVLDPDPQGLAGPVSHRLLAADYVDPAALDEIARDCAGVTIEFENVPAAALRRLEGRCRVAPGSAAVEICQDRAAEKRHFAAAGVPCAPHAVLVHEADLAAVDPALFPAILKTSRLGYDGKGQAAVAAAADLPAAWAGLRRAPCVLEKRLPLRAEISVIVARADDGTTVHLPVQQNLHRSGILAVTQVPGPAVDDALTARAVAWATALAGSMEYVGVLCVEFFVLADGALVANEMAPRPHNSGHYSIDACDVSQFELQVRSLAGLPLVAPRQHSPAVMLNLLGDLWWRAGASAPAEPDWAPVLSLPGVHLHLYGKAEARRGRKMGHLTVTAVDAATAGAVARQACERLGLGTY